MKTREENEERYPSLHKPHRDASLVPEGFLQCTQYKEVRYKDYKISTSLRDRCVTISKKPALVRNILFSNSEIMVVYQCYRECADFFVYPCTSALLGIHKVWDLHTRLRIASIREVSVKNMIMPHKNRFVIPIGHTQDKQRTAAPAE